MVSCSGPNATLTKAEESKLVEWIVHMNGIGYGQTTRELKYAVKKLLDADGRNTLLSNNMPGRDWLQRFMKSHPDISLRCGEALGRESSINC